MAEVVKAGVAEAAVMVAAAEWVAGVVKVAKVEAEVKAVAVEAAAVVGEAATGAAAEEEAMEGVAGAAGRVPVRARAQEWGGALVRAEGL